MTLPSFPSLVIFSQVVAVCYRADFEGNLKSQLEMFRRGRRVRRGTRAFKNKKRYWKFYKARFFIFKPTWAPMTNMDFLKFLVGKFMWGMLAMLGKK
ncbi:MAG TPA: hypothetical protein DDW50_03030 [Firmicutes bacterium]|jgi:hypothetical protein|nr:hypothetical protein [Bacillota bacterium]